MSDDEVDVRPQRQRYSVQSPKESDELKKQRQIEEVLLELGRPIDTSKVKERYLSPELQKILIDPCAQVKDIVQDHINSFSNTSIRANLLDQLDTATSVQ